MATKKNGYRELTAAEKQLADEKVAKYMKATADEDSDLEARYTELSDALSTWKSEDDMRSLQAGILGLQRGITAQRVRSWGDPVAMRSVESAYEKYQQLLQDFDEKKKSYGGYSSAEEFAKGLQEYQWSQKYGGQSYDDLSRLLPDIQNGDEAAWLESYMDSPAVKNSAYYDQKIKSLQDQYDALLAENGPDLLALGHTGVSTVGSSEGEDILDQINALQEQRWVVQQAEKYQDLPNAADFEQLSSDVQSTLKLGGLIGDGKYEYINNIDGYRQREDASKAMSGGSPYAVYGNMTDEEIANYNYLYRKEGKESADAYLDYLEYTLNQRQNQTASESSSKFADEHPVAASAISVPANLLSGAGLVDVAGQQIVKKYTGSEKPIDYNRSAMQFNTTTQAIRSTVGQNIADATGVVNLDPEKHQILAPLLNGKSLADVYQLGMSMADSAAIAGLSALGIPGGTVLLGGSAGTQGMLDALDRGATDGQALTMGILNGTFEALFEYVSLDKLLSDAPAIGFKDYLVKVLAQAGVEASEEVSTTLANTVGDLLVMGDFSEVRSAIREYQANGMDEQTAQKQAWEDWGVSLLWDAVGGALSGGVMGSVSTGLQTVSANRQAGKAVVESGTLESLRSIANSLDEGSRSYQLENQIKDQVKVGAVNENSSTGKIGQFARQVQQDVEAELNQAESGNSLSEVYRRLSQFTNEATQQELDSMYQAAAVRLGVEPETQGSVQTPKSESYVDLVLRKQDGSEETIQRIVSDSALRRMFTERTGVEITGNNSQTRQAVKEAILGNSQETAGTAKDGTVEAPNVTTRISGVQATTKDGSTVKVNGVKTGASGEMVLDTSAGDMKLSDVTVKNQNMAQILNIASNYGGNIARNFVANYDGSMPVKQYWDAYNAFLSSGRLGASEPGFTMERALGINSYYRTVLTDKVAREAYTVGLEAAQAENQKVKQETKRVQEKGKGRAGDKTTTKKVGQDRLVKVLDAFAKKTGLNVELVDQIKTGEYEANGRLVAATMTMQLSANADNVLQALGHESGEFVSAFAPEAKAELRQDILKWWAYHENMNSIDALITKYQKRYQNATGGETYNQAVDEIVNDALGTLLTTDEGMEQLLAWLDGPANMTVEQKVSFLQKMKNAIQAVINGLKAFLKGKEISADTRRFLEMEVQSQKEILDKFFQAIDQAGRNAERTGEYIDEKSTSISLKKDLNDYPYDMQTVIRDYIDAADEKVLAFVQEVQDGKAWKGKKVTVGTVNEKMASDIERLAGVSGAYGSGIVLNTSAVEHIVSRHGANGSGDHSMRNNLDLARINYILQNYDTAEVSRKASYGYRNKDNSPATSILLSKKINGTYFVVEAVPDTGKVGIITAYISKKGTSQVLDDNAPSSDVRNVLASVPENSIPQSAENVNVKYSLQFDDEDDFLLSMGEEEDHELFREEQWAADFEAGAPARNAYQQMEEEVQAAIRGVEQIAMQMETAQARKDSREALKKLSAATERLVEYWKGQTQPSKGPSFDQALEREARKLRRSYQSTMDTQELAKGMRQVYAAYQKGGYSAAMETAQRLATQMVEKAVDSEEGLYSRYADLRKRLKGTTLSISAEDAHDIPDFNAWRRRNQNRFRVSIAVNRSTANVGAIFQDLESEYSEFFSEADTSTPSDQLLRISEVMDAVYSDRGSNPYAGSIQEVAAEAAMEMVQRVAGLRFTESTFADQQAQKLQQAVDSAKEEAAQEMKKLLAEAQAQADSSRYTIRDLSISLSAEKAAGKNLLADAMTYGRKLSQAQEQVRALEAEVKAQENKIKEAYQDWSKDALASDKAYQQALLDYSRKLSQASRNIQKAQDRLEKYKGSRAERDAVTKYRARVLKKAKKLQNMLLKNSDKEHIPEALKEPVGEFLLSVDYSSKSLMESGRATKSDAKYTEALDRLRQVLQRQANYMVNPENGGIDVYIDLPAGFVNVLQEHINSVKAAASQMGADNQVFAMSSVQLRELDNILTVIGSAVRNTNRLLANAHYANVFDAARNSVNEMLAMGPASKRTGKVSGFFKWENTLPYFAFQRFGEGGKSIFQALAKGWDTLAFNSKQIIEFTEKTYTSKEVKTWGQEQHTIRVESGREVQMTAAQIMSLYCLARREQAMGHLMGGGMRVGNIKSKGGTISQTEPVLLTLADVSNITSRLSDRQKAVADQLQRYMSTTGSRWGNEVSVQRFGYKAFGEENYFPIESDSTNLPAIDPDAKANDLFRLLNLSATKSLTYRANNALVVSDIFDVFANHMADMAKYNALALPILDAMKWYNYKDQQALGNGQIITQTVQRAMERAYGKEAGRYFITFMRDLNGTQEGGRGEDIYNKLISNYKVAAVAANLRVALLQPTAYVRAVATLDPYYMAKAFTMKNGYREMEQYSGIAVWKGMGFYDTNISRGLRAKIKNEATMRDNVVEKSMALAELGDRITWGRLWNACKVEVKAKQHLTGDALIEATAERFREVVYSTQVVDSTMTRSQSMRSKSTFSKMALSFMSEPTLSYNQLLSAWDEYQIAAKRTGNKGTAWRQAGGKIVRGLSAYAATAVAAALAESLMDALRDDDKYESFGEKYWEAFWGLDGNFAMDMLPLNKLPLLKDVVSFATGYGNDRMDTESVKNAYDAVLIWAETIQLATGQQTEPTDITYNGKMTTYGKIYKSLKALSQLSGLPASNLAREAITIYNNTVGTITGQPIATYDPGDKSSIKYAFQDGYLTQDEAIEELEITGMTGDEAYWEVQGWQTGGGKKAKLEQAVAVGDIAEIQAAMDELARHGEDAASAAKSAIRKAYFESYLPEETASSFLEEFAAMNDTDDIYWLLREWKYLRENPDSEYGKYDTFVNAVRTGKNLKTVIAEYTSHGVTAQTLAGEITKAYKEEYISLYNTNKTKAADLQVYLLNAYVALGYDRDKKIKDIAAWLND